MKEKLSHRIYSNVSAREFALLQTLCKEYGFKSIYCLIQTLVRALLRYANTSAYEDEEFSLGKEVEDMFDEMLSTPEAERDAQYERRRQRR